MAKEFLLSDILTSFSPEEDVRIRREKPFAVLALAVHSLPLATCVFVDTADFVNRLPANVAMVITAPELEDMLSERDVGLCVCPDARKLFFRLHNYLSQTDQLKRELVPTTVGEGTKIHPLTSIAENNVQIGKNVVIEEFVVIRENTVIGDHSIIRAGCVIGGTGFEFKRDGRAILPIAHDGGVVIGSRVEIQQNSCVDRAIYVWDDTLIGDDSKIDNLVHIAHGVKIGRGVLTVANVGYGGRDIVEDECWIGFGATLRNGIRIGRGARVNMGAVVTKDVPDYGSVTGNFAIDHDAFIAKLKKDR